MYLWILWVTKYYTSMHHGLSQTPINDAIMNINTNALCDHGYYIRLSLQFGYIYEHYAQAHMHTVINE